MFLYNLKLNGKKLITFLFLFLFIIVVLILLFGIYKIFFDSNNLNNKNDLNYNSNSDIILSDTIRTNKVYEITPQNYSSILQTVTDDVDSYIGAKIHFIGYVYRLIDFKENEFVLARDMRVNLNSNKTLVIGFLSEYDKAKDFADGTWVDVTGEIVKGDYYGDIAKIKVTNMFETSEPEVKQADPPDKTYIPTNNMF